MISENRIEIMQARRLYYADEIKRGVILNESEPV